MHSPNSSLKKCDVCGKELSKNSPFSNHTGCWVRNQHKRPILNTQLIERKVDTRGTAKS